MIKNSLIIISTLMLAVCLLNARANPFQPTQTYKEEKSALLKSLNNSMINQKNDSRTIKLIPQDNPKNLEEIIVKKTVANSKKIKTYKYNLLSFVKINIKNDIMNISTKYKLKKHFTIKEENKLVFDYIGKKRFYTKRETLSSHKDFNKIIIGAHPRSCYFRVVIQTKSKVSNYKVHINKKGLITIKRIRK